MVCWRIIHPVNSIYDLCGSEITAAQFFHDMNNISLLLKPVSSLCNMKCKYCFYLDESVNRATAVYGLMSSELAKKIVDNVMIDLSEGDVLSIAFQGGEPTLAGLGFFTEVTEYIRCHASARSIKVDFSIQTNGLLLDVAWCDFLKKNDFLVGLSIDGPKEINDQTRIDKNGLGTFDRIMAAKKLLDSFSVRYNVLLTLTQQMAQSPELVWKFILENKIEYVQFMPCLKTSAASEDIAVTPELYASFYMKIYDLWNGSFEDSVRIKLFSDLEDIARFGRCKTCGLMGNCQLQLVVEADGSVFPCDFYALDEYCIGNLKDSSVRKLIFSKRVKDYLSLKAELPNHCDDCEYFDICGGGCRRMRREVFGLDSKTCGHQILLQHILS